MHVRTWVILVSFVILQACSSKIAVMTLEQTIRNAAVAVQKGSNGASTKLQIAVAVTNGYRVSGRLPIAVVPIQISTSSSIVTKLKLEVDLTTFKSEKALSTDKSVFILDTATGALQSP